MKLIDMMKNFVARILNGLHKKSHEAVLFYPHGNCRFDGYDILNGDSDNVLCLLNNMLRDSCYKDYNFYVVYYHEDRLAQYIEYCSQFGLQRVHFIPANKKTSVMKAVFKCYTIFTDTDYTRLFYRVRSHRKNSFFTNPPK